MISLVPDDFLDTIFIYMIKVKSVRNELIVGFPYIAFCSIQNYYKEIGVGGGLI